MRMAPSAVALALAASVAVAQVGCHEQTPPPVPEASARCVPARDADGRIKRDYRQRRAFIEANPCPVTGSTDYRRSCPGFHVDHVIPLACCGADDPSNMKWTPAAENLAKGARCPWDPVPAVSQ